MGTGTGVEDALSGDAGERAAGGGFQEHEDGELVQSAGNPAKLDNSTNVIRSFYVDLLIDSCF